MPTVVVRCPNCGHEFVIDVLRERPKGRGAHYARKIRKLTPLHETILRVLAEMGPLPKRRLGVVLAEQYQTYGRYDAGSKLAHRPLKPPKRHIQHMDDMMWFWCR